MLLILRRIFIYGIGALAIIGGFFMTTDFIKVSELAKATGFSERTIRRWISKGKLKAVKLSTNNQWLIAKEELSRLLNK